LLACRRLFSKHRAKCRSGGNPTAFTAHPGKILPPGGKDRPCG